MPHGGWLEMAIPFIGAFHAGDTKPDSFITEDKLIYWYRPTPKRVECDATDNCNKPWPSSTPNVNYFEGRPHGADTLADAVFVVALLTRPGDVVITSGEQSQTFQAPTGASSWSIAMRPGKQSFALQRNGNNVLSGESLKEIVDHCVCGLYNFNAYVGYLSPSSSEATRPQDALQTEGLSKFKVSMSATCEPTPSIRATA